MRYSFHGKVRATGQQVDGYVEAANSTEAIDRLADRGIIGVYTVRPEPKPPKDAVRLAGDPEPEEEPKPQPRRLAAPAPQPAAPPAPLPVVQAPVSAPVLAVAPGASEQAMSAMMEKLGGLMAQMERALARPQQVIYQNSGHSRGGGGGGGDGGGKVRSKSKNYNEAQNSTLRDIFQTNLDLRQSLAKLAGNTVVAPAIDSRSEPHRESNGEPIANGNSNGKSVHSPDTSLTMIDVEPVV